MVEAGGARSVSAAMRANPDDIMLQQSGCCALDEMAAVDTAQRVVDVGGCAAVVAMLRVHLDSPVLLSGCKALVRMSLAAAQAVVDAGKQVSCAVERREPLSLI